MNNFYRYKPFGILRFVLALLVLVQHFCDNIAPLNIKQAIFPWAPGNVAVLGFFMMSGFIICEAYQYNYQGRPLAYLYNRFLRIVPAYWAALAVSFIVHLYIYHHNGHVIGSDHQDLVAGHFSGKNILKNIFAFVPGVNLDVSPTEYPFFAYFWALQTEMMFYLAVFGAGCVSLYVQRYRRWTYEHCLALAAGLSLIVAVGSQMNMLPHKLVYSSYFVFGGSLYYFLEGRRKALYLLVPALVELLWRFHNADAADFVDMLPNRSGQFFLLSAFQIAFIGLASIQVKKTSVDRWFGELSYSLYLNHFAVSIFILNLASQFSISYLFAGLIASLVLAWLMHGLVEKPIMRLRQSIRRNTIIKAEEEIKAENAVS